MKVFAEDFRTMQQKHIVSAYFTFVGVDDNLCPVAIPAVMPESDEERRRYQQAEHRRAQRLKAR
jgi:acyl-CoA hydrolase